MFSLRMARVEPCSEATKTVAILVVKPSKIVRFENTGVWLFIRRVSGVYRMCISHVFMLNARLMRVTVNSIECKSFPSPTRYFFM